MPAQKHANSKKMSQTIVILFKGDCNFTAPVMRPMTKRSTCLMHERRYGSRYFCERT